MKKYALLTCIILNFISIVSMDVQSSFKDDLALISYDSSDEYASCEEYEIDIPNISRRNTHIELIQQIHIRYMITLKNMLGSTEITELPFLTALEEYTSNNQFPAFMSLLTEVHSLVQFESLEELSIDIKLKLKNLVKNKNYTLLQLIAFIEFASFFEVTLLIDPLTDASLPLIVDIAKSRDNTKLHEMLHAIPYPIHAILKEKLSSQYAADLWTALGSEVTRQHIPYNRISQTTFTQSGKFIIHYNDFELTAEIRDDKGVLLHTIDGKGTDLPEAQKNMLFNNNLVVMQTDNNIKIWKIDTAELIKEFTVEHFQSFAGQDSTQINYVYLDENILVIVFDKKILLFKMNTFDQCYKILSFTNYSRLSVYSRLLEISDIFISPDQSRIIVYAESGTIIYDLTNGQIIKNLPNTYVLNIRFSDDSKFVAISDAIFENGRIIIYTLKDMEIHKIILTNPTSYPLIDFIPGKYELIRNCKNTCISTQENGLSHNHIIDIAVNHPSEAVEPSESLQSSGWRTPFINSSHLFLDADHTLTYSKFSQSLVAFNFRNHTSKKIISLFPLFTDDIKAKLSHDKKVLLIIRESSLTILTLSPCLEKYSFAELLQKIHLPNSSCVIL